MKSLAYDTKNVVPNDGWSSVTRNARELALRRMVGADLVMVAFLITQVLDGWLTYLGIYLYGIAAEGNPVLAYLMEVYGVETGLVLAKSVAALCGACLHLLAVDRLLAALTLVYVVAAIVPWTLILF